VAAVVITGMGCVSAAGVGVEPFRTRLFAGESLVRPLAGPRFDGLRIRHAAQIAQEEVDRHLSAKDLSATDPFSRYAMLAADEALRMAGFQSDHVAGADTAVIIGTGIGGEMTHDQGSFAVYAEKSSRVDVLTIPKVMPSAAASHLSMRYQITGPTFAVSSACASGTQAIGLGMLLLRSGLARRALVGGSEAMLTYSTMRAWEAMRVMTPTVCRPFSQGRNGMVLGDGAAVFLIERGDVAAERGASVLAELVGYGTTSDGKDILRPDPQGCADAIAAALADAGLRPGEVDYINAHGTGTVANDVTEAEAIRSVFGEAKVPVSSTKPIHGHMLGAAGAIELVASVLALQEQCLPPNINWLEADPHCQLDIVHQARAAAVGTVLSNSFAFGGVNAALVIRRHADR